MRKLLTATTIAASVLLAAEPAQAESPVTYGLIMLTATAYDGGHHEPIQRRMTAEECLARAAEINAPIPRSETQFRHAFCMKEPFYCRLIDRNAGARFRGEWECRGERL